MVVLSIIIASGAIGLGGGVHCVAMCGPTSMAITRDGRSALAFHAGRLAGYGLLGGVASSGAIGLAHAASAAAWLHPIWVMGNVLLALLGLWMLVTGRHPVVVQEGLLRMARVVMRAGGAPAWVPAGAQGGEVRVPVSSLVRVGSQNGRQVKTAALAGVAWALWPCGMLYSAVAVAWLAKDVLTGMLAMMAFGAASGLQLWLGQRGMMKLLRAGKESVAIRMAGAVTVAVAGVMIAWVAMGHAPSDFCLPGQR